MNQFRPLLAWLLLVSTLQAAEYHVSTSGDDGNAGTRAQPLRTISRAAELAQPGDVITVHEGIYRERINPPRGGTSDDNRIVYQAAEGETVSIKGSEVVTGWEKMGNDTWKVTLPDAFFGEFNPFKELIAGDWFNPKGRVHHLGAVYLDGHWLTETATFDKVLEPAGETPLWYTPAPATGPRGSHLLNVAWFQPQKAPGRVRADGFSAQRGIKTAACREGGQCIGWIDEGDWVRYDNVDFGSGSEQIEFRSASPSGGGTIEVRLDKPDGSLLGSCTIADTGDWKQWKTFAAKIQPTEGKKTICLVFRPSRKDAPPIELDDDTTTIWAQFKGVDPNQGNVEVCVREAVFYPEKPGVNFITVRGFTLEHAAPNWAPPTAEQVGLIGTHWSQGWIIEDNTIRYSICTGITLGKHGDEFDNTSQNSAVGYVETIKRAHAFQIPWTRQNIGHHVVRNNHIAHCEQAGIVGSMGAAFSTVSGNTIHDINMRALFDGAEQAGIKFHGAIDAVISHNHIHHTIRGIWLDWMTQGTRVTGNLLHDNGPREDLFVEVNHGPFLVDNNVLLSRTALLEASGGGAYAHNLFAGQIRVRQERTRDTPYHPPHSTTVAGLSKVVGDDERFYNNLFVSPAGLTTYDQWGEQLQAAGNVYVNGAKPSQFDRDPITDASLNPQLKLIESDEGVTLQIRLNPAWAQQQRPLVTSELLGKAKIPNLPFVQADDSPYRIDTDYFGEKRSEDNPAPGPFRSVKGGKVSVKVWPRKVDLSGHPEYRGGMTGEMGGQILKSE